MDSRFNTKKEDQEQDEKQARHFERRPSIINFEVAVKECEAERKLQKEEQQRRLNRLSATRERVPSWYGFNNDDLNAQDTSVLTQSIFKQDQTQINTATTSQPEKPNIYNKKKR